MANRHREVTTPTTVAIDNRQMKELTGRLDAIVRLLAINLPADLKQETKVRLLSDSGFQPKDIGKILGTSPNAVSVALSKMRRRDRVEQLTAQGDTTLKNETDPEQEPAEMSGGNSGPGA